jgi:hypothetical protein
VKEGRKVKDGKGRKEGRWWLVVGGDDDNDDNGDVWWLVVISDWWVDWKDQGRDEERT